MTTRKVRRALNSGAAVIALGMCASCGSTGSRVESKDSSQPVRVVESPAPERPSGTDPIDDARERPSIRASLQGDEVSILGRVDRAAGAELSVTVEEVLSDGLGASRGLADCPKLHQGDRLAIFNETSGYRNDLSAGDLALFVGETCGETRLGRIELQAMDPNGRRVDSGNLVDLGGGDLATLDEVRQIAGADLKPVTAVAAPLDASVEVRGHTMTLSLTGRTEARLGVTVCKPGLVNLESPVVDYFGPCTMLTPADDSDANPLLMTSGKVVAEYGIHDEFLNRGDVDVVVFGQFADGNVKVVAISPAAL